MRRIQQVLTYKPLTNNAVQEIELRKYLQNKISQILQTHLPHISIERVPNKLLWGGR